MRLAGWLKGCKGSGGQVLLGAAACVLLLGPACVEGQQDPSFGTVMGRVVAQDTQRPVRFAQVMLQSVASANSDSDNDRRGDGAVTRTDAEGNFVAGNVAPGDYYVTAAAAGYIPERSLLQVAVSAGADPAAALAQVPVAHVVANQSSAVTVTIERGGMISGKVQWEDGSPAAGVSLSVVPVAGSGAVSSLGNGQGVPEALKNFQSAGASGFAQTDDRGMYRIAGLVSGDYLLRSVIQAAPQAGAGSSRMSMYGPPIRMYAPGVFRRADAKPVRVKAGEEHSDVALTLDLRELRTITGHASSASAGLSVASGRVAVVDPNDGELQLGGSIMPDGDFMVRYVPAGSYMLKVTGASTQVDSGRRREADPTRGVAFQPFSQPLVVADRDVTGVGVVLNPVAPQP